MKNKYDVIVIGAGIGGLVCGCYLAKEGLKTLIVEQHNKHGGYCSSFQRKGYNFDIGVHYLGSLKKGILNSILNELEIDLPISRINPTDKIIMPDNVIYIKTTPKATIMEFKKRFPKEARNIEKFFTFILDVNFLNIYKKTKKLTFNQVLDEFFEDYRLKAIFNLLLGNIGLSAKIAAALPAIILFREYILDCGYYPQGGMQKFPDKILEKYRYFGGLITYSKKVVKIINNSNRKKIILEDGEVLHSNVLVSNADATETFKQLLDKKNREYFIVDKLKPSSSAFLVYLGLTANLNNMLSEKANIWYFSSYKIDKIYSHMRKEVPQNDLECLQISFPSLHDINYHSNKSVVTLFIHAPFKSKIFWEKHKNEIGEIMISKASNIIRELIKYIDLKIYATPYTLYEYTLNKNGSFVGWLSILNQLRSSILPQRTSIKGLYCVGHWYSMGYPGYGGIPNVALSGRRGAMYILNDLNKNWPYKNLQI